MSTFERLKALFCEVYEEELPLEKLTTEARLAEDLGMKSIAMLYMAMAVEQEFGVKFDNSDFAQMKTVQDIINKIENQ